MQLFPDTHPATLHTVLTLSKNNFFYAIDKLLYAKKCKNNFSKRQTYPFKSGRGRGGYTSARGRQPYNRNMPGYQSVTRTISDDLAEVQRIIGLAEKPYMEVQSISTEDINDEDSNITNSTHQVMNICVENSEEIGPGSQTFVDAENQEVIEIVCFENEQQMEQHLVEPQKIDDSMELENFTENDIEDDVGIHTEYEKESESEPAVIVVDTINDLEESEIIEESHLIESHEYESHQLDSADFTNDCPLTEETGENDMI